MTYIIQALSKIPDPRQAWKVKHSLAEILLISILAVTAGANSSGEIHLFAVKRKEWLREFMELKNGVPGRLTIERVLQRMNGKAFQAIFEDIMKNLQRKSAETVVSIDGKACFSASDHKGASGVVTIVSAWCSANGLVLGQVETGEKKNEITAIPELLKLLDIQGATVTMDAMGCQKQIIRQIVKKNKAHYVVALKRNHQTFWEEATLFASYCLSTPLMADEYTQFTHTEKGHGRIEKRTYTLFHDMTWFEDREEWESLQSLIMVESSVTKLKGSKPPSHEVRFYISDHSDVHDAARAIRSHWGVENNLHWVLDVVLKEDNWKTKSDRSAAFLAVLRRLTLNLLRAETESGLTGPHKRFACALDCAFLEKIVFHSPLFS